MTRNEECGFFVMTGWALLTDEKCDEKQKAERLTFPSANIYTYSQHNDSFFTNVRLLPSADATYAIA